MNVLLVAQDKAPSDAFGLLGTELYARGHKVVLLAGGGKVFPASTDEIHEAVREANIVVVGMSSSAKLAAPEIAACEAAVRQTKLFGFYGDTYHAYQRAAQGSWFGPYSQLADFFFAINKEEADKARKVFTDLTPETSVVTGNPSWESYAFPKFTRAEVRANYGIADDEIMVLSTVSKTTVVNILIYGLLVEALSGPELKSRIFISHHPGDRTPYAVDQDEVQKTIGVALDNLAINKVGGQANVSLTGVQNIIANVFSDPKMNLNIYNDLKTFSSVPVELIPSDVKTLDVLPGADVVVEWQSSIAIAAAHQRIPVISVSTELGRKRLYSTSKTEKWEPVELGISEGVGVNVDEIREAIQWLTDVRQTHSFSLRVAQRNRQAEVYPKPQEKGSAVRKMAETLEELVK